jgi:glycosyltransferase involved in cell wall biosynthesis
MRIRSADRAESEPGTLPVAGPLRVELDVTYRAPEMSGIATYTRALAEELATAAGVDLVVRIDRRVPQTLAAGLQTKRLRFWGRLVVRPGWVRLVPHQMRPPALFGATVVTVHDLIHLGPWASLPKRAAFRLLLRLFRRSNVRVLAVSHATRSRLISVGFDPRHVAVCQSTRPAGARSPNSLRAPRCGGGGFAYVGNLRPHKGVDVLVQAHARLVDRSPGPSLHIVTSAGDDEIRRLRSYYSDATAQWFCVHQRGSDVERDAVLQHAVACVAPSLEEGYGYSIDEADAMGTPIIASLIPSHLENGVGRRVIFAPPGDVGALYSALRSALGTGGVPAGRIDQSQAEQLRGRTDVATTIRVLTSDGADHGD